MANIDANYSNLESLKGGSAFSVSVCTMSPHPRDMSVHPSVFRNKLLSIHKLTNCYDIVCFENINILHVGGQYRE